jgi:hypothetical protein
MPGPVIPPGRQRSTALAPVLGLARAAARSDTGRREGGKERIGHRPSGGGTASARSGVASGCYRRLPLQHMARDSMPLSSAITRFISGRSENGLPMNEFAPRLFARDSSASDTLPEITVMGIRCSTGSERTREIVQGILDRPPRLAPRHVRPTRGSFYQLLCALPQLALAWAFLAKHIPALSKSKVMAPDRYHMWRIIRLFTWRSRSVAGGK